MGDQDEDACGDEHSAVRTSEAALLGMLSEGDSGQPPPNLPALAQLLSSVADPATADSPTAGEQAAVAAYRAHHQRPAARSPRSRTALLGGALVLALSGGATWIASPGVHFPTDQRPSAPERTTALPHPSPSVDGTDGPTEPPRPDLPTVGPTESALAPEDEAGPNAESLTQIRQLCQEYQRLPAGQRAEALATRRFQRLVSAAGERSRVAEYCAELRTGPAAETPVPSSVQRSTPPEGGEHGGQRGGDPGGPGEGNPNGGTGNSGDGGQSGSNNGGGGGTPTGGTDPGQPGHPSGDVGANGAGSSGGQSQS